MGHNSFFTFFHHSSNMFQAVILTELVPFGAQMPHHGGNDGTIRLKFPGLLPREIWHGVQHPGFRAKVDLPSINGRSLSDSDCVSLCDFGQTSSTLMHTAKKYAVNMLLDGKFRNEIHFVQQISYWFSLGAKYISLILSNSNGSPRNLIEWIRIGSVCLSSLAPRHFGGTDGTEGIIAPNDCAIHLVQSIHHAIIATKVHKTSRVS